ncbi:RNA 3'-terminal phosphate cyclase [Natronorubrum sulfidifaciens]|uniref:RNA 3'-terminal phosphate cyclase n=1 Tax=Natronorubrum sulfidifaciens JCM 14089 TaxID=1230460 RepID=L9WDU2_9EURY|nr:RNA 3'-terminal phosphate cyclase [Natronorubrum sulfidifaciens]ELY47492.1 RNA 3'-terminal-phosphate cyclase [Natronorubrum sulfidifaciens JCM 14089]
MTAVRELDGSEAGGQFVRTALTLSVLENEPVRIERIRDNRPNPGLAHQHLAVLETMVELCDAEVSGAELDSKTVAFDPALESTANATGWRGQDRGRLSGGSYTVDIGTAGSMTLLFDTLLPLASVLDSQLSVTVTGGTDVKWSPPLDYFRHVKLPLLRRFGLTAACDVDRRGFYPNGGGRATLHLAPSSLESIDLVERGSPAEIRLHSVESASLSDRDVAHRQAEGALERLSLEDTGIELTERRESTVSSPSPGSAIVLRLDHGTGIAGWSALGERGTPAERVGEDAADAANRFLEATGEPASPVDRHLADQLLVYLALEGGQLRVPTVTDHVATSCDLLEAFGAQLEVAHDEAGETALVTVESTVDA